MMHLQVDKVAYNDRGGEPHHEVQVTLADSTWQAILLLLCQQLYRARVRGAKPFTKVMAIGAARRGDRVEALARLRNHALVGQETPSLTFSPQEATELAQALLEAAEEPVACRCGRLVEQPSQLVNSCGICEDGS
jgi:hypothetical protein